LSTCYARPLTSAPAKDLEACLRDTYAGSPFVEIVSPEEVTLASVVGTNMCRLGVAARGDVVVVVGAIDNLVKGAAGQALQNVNLALGFDEGCGLSGLHRSAA
jgi:N-acetyl-gamma-glutamyl-phosphate reductase